MQFSVTTATPQSAAADLLVIGLFEGEALEGALATLNDAVGGAIADLLDTGDFTGKVGQTDVLYPRGIAARRLLIVGLGKRDSFSTETLRRTAAISAARAKDVKAKQLAMRLHGDGTSLTADARAHAIAEGLLLGSYYYHGQKSSEMPAEYPESVTLIAADSEQNAATAGVSAGVAFGEATRAARTWVNMPPNLCTPQFLAQQAREIAAKFNMKVEVFDTAQMEAMKMGALLGVARGSVIPPQFIVLEHQPERAAEGKTVVLVGKGITFDTGGYDIKTADSMLTMKTDMAGAAAVLGAMHAIGALSVPRHVVALVPATYNMISGDAFLPSEVLVASNGLSIEVGNTDAEGRLILADALVYAARYKPQAVLDLATLTGSMAIALGSAAAGFYSTDSMLSSALNAAAETSGDKLWQMPLFQEYEKPLESKVADTKSTGVRFGGANIAAAFLRKFTSYPAWAHIDIAGVAFDVPDSPLVPGGGATGYGVRLLADYIRRLN